MKFKRFHRLIASSLYSKVFNSSIFLDCLTMKPCLKMLLSNHYLQIKLKVILLILDRYQYFVFVLDFFFERKTQSLDELTASLIVCPWYLLLLATNGSLLSSQQVWAKLNSYWLNVSCILLLRVVGVPLMGCWFAR